MEQSYAHALMRLVESGKSPSDAVASIVKALHSRGRDSLLPRVGRAFERLATRHTQKNIARITVAHAEDAGLARKSANISEADVHIDDSLIGGWRILKNEMLTDASYKKHLLQIYNRATRA